MLRAQQNIGKGEEITTLYLPTLIGNVVRRVRINKNWKFDCLCERCQDKTEFGTNLSTIVCQECSKNNRKDGYMLPDDPTEYYGQWSCHKCSANVNGLTVYALVKELQREAEEIKSINPEEVERSIANLSSTLHPNHYVLLTLKRRLLDLYRLIPNPEDPQELRKKLERQVELGNQVLDILNRIEPGLSLTRGRVLRNIHQPILRLGKLNLNEKKISMNEFMVIAKTSIRNMKQAVKCLEDFDLFYVASANSNVSYSE